MLYIGWVDRVCRCTNVKRVIHVKLNSPREWNMTNHGALHNDCHFYFQKRLTPRMALLTVPMNCVHSQWLLQDSPGPLTLLGFCDSQQDLRTIHNSWADSLSLRLHCHWNREWSLIEGLVVGLLFRLSSFSWSSVIWWMMAKILFPSLRQQHLWLIWVHISAGQNALSSHPCSPAAGENPNDAPERTETVSGYYSGAAAWIVQ